MPAKNKHVYLSLAALAIAGLLVDRLILPTPSSAEAPLVARFDSVSSLSIGSSTTLSATISASVPELPFPRNLPTWSPDEPIRDIFSPASSTAISDNHRRNGAVRDPDGYGTVVALQRDHHLDAILVNERLKIAVIGGRRVGMGQEIGGCQIVAVEGHQVRFRCRDGDPILSLSPSVTPTGD